MKKIILLLIAFHLFLITASAQYTKLLDFNVSNGANPAAQLLLIGNTLYGTTQLGGAHDSGCVFSIDTNGHNYKDLHDFAGYPTDGSKPSASLVLYGTKLFGVTNIGGSTAYGVAFSVDTNGTHYKVLLNFNNVNGSFPWNAFIVLHNKLYGTASGDEITNNGNIFSIDTDGTGYRDIYDFSGGSGGASPVSSLTLSGHTFFGSTNAGGSQSSGIIFSIDTNGTNFKKLIDLSEFTGYGPTGSLTLSNGRLFSTEQSGGFVLPGSYGNVISIDTDGSGYKQIFCFNSNDGMWPEGNITLVGHTLYGMVNYGGIYDGGFIFSVDTNNTDTVVHHLIDFNITDGASPNEGGLTVSGNSLYGITSAGGTHGKGVVFKYGNIATGINVVTAAKPVITVYPNPGNGIFQVKSDKGLVNSTIEVYNVLGEKVYSDYQITKSPNYQIDLSNQPTGMYFYKVISDKGDLKGSGKLMIVK